MEVNNRVCVDLYHCTVFSRDGKHILFFFTLILPPSNDDLSAFGSSMVRLVCCLTILAVACCLAVSDVNISLPYFFLV